ncbi:MAG: hypothetical protein LBI62_09955 [Candidatus Accumulibacter sp.]|nr:hypothetical protein [Accumulibacter sp.]
MSIQETDGQGSGIRDQGSGIRDQGSGIRNQESGIRNQESGIRNQKFMGAPRRGEGKTMRPPISSRRQSRR